ncbi:MAG: hypothetical protein OXU37_06545 [Thaumarchaeota archaeon]|nr:hypothetical protein [Nitrososphaerota archaeon]
MQVAVSHLGSVEGEAGLEAALCAIMRHGAAAGRGLRTFVLNLEDMAPLTSRRAGVSWESRPAGLDGVEIVSCRDSSGRVPECEMYLDRRAGRFGLAHMGEAGAVADAAIDLLARTTQASRAWVCPSVMDGLARRRPDGAGQVAISRSARDGNTTAVVRCDGALLSRGGEAIRAHLRLADEVRAAYSLMCSNAEEMRLGFADTPQGHHLVGSAIRLVLSREISDVPGFVDGVLDGSPPLRMFGGCKKAGGGRSYMVPLSDLENGIYMGSTFHPGRVSVTLHPRSSATGLLRLIAHMQLCHDPLLDCPQVTTGVPGG